MTPIGHSLMGLAIGYVVVPRDFSKREKSIALAAFVMLTNAPDWPLPGWGHDRYDVSHSLFVTMAGVTLTGVAAAVLLRRTPYLQWRSIVGGAVAWLSHLLLDTLYDGRKGLAMFWPVSDARVSLPVPCFRTMQLSPLVSAHNASVFAIEAVVYGSILGLVWFGRQRIERLGVDEQ
jgi:hypothetical protein